MLFDTMRLTPALLALASMLSLTAGACGGDDTVQVTLTDFALEAEPAHVTTGAVTFDVKNVGEEDHEFAILRTDLAPQSLPIIDGEWVDEEAAGIEEVGGFDHVLPGKAKQLELDLTAGAYVLICNMQGHYQMGMSLPFTVTD